MLKTMITTLPLLLLLSCDQPPGESSSHQQKTERKPKTFYGKSVKRTKDLSNQTSQRDKEITEQAKEMFGK